MSRLVLITTILLGASFILPLQAARHSGIVRSGAQPVPGATVTATKESQTLTTTTDETGSYVFENLDTGVWLIEVQAFGFAKTGLPVISRVDPTSLEWDLAIEIPPAATAAASAPAETFPVLKMKSPASAPAAVEVAAAQPPEPEPQQADSGAASAAFLMTGSVSRGLEAAIKEESKPEKEKKEKKEKDEVRRAAHGHHSVDGRLTSVANAQVFGAGPAEVKVSKSGKISPGSSDSKSSGKGAKIVSRVSTGTPASSFGNRRRSKNPIQGSAYFNMRNSALDARPYSLSGQTLDQPAYAQNRFGISAGGQLRIPGLLDLERTNFYFSYSGIRSRNPYSANATVPTALERGGDFSQSVARWPVQIFDPSSNLPYPNNRIPASQFNPASAGLLQFIPEPNLPGRVQNYQNVASVPSNTNSFSGRLSQGITRYNRIDFSVNYQGRQNQPMQLFGFRDAADGLGFNSTAGWTHNFGRRGVNNLRFNFSRNRNQTLPYFAYTSDIAGQLGIQGTSDEPINYGPPNLSFTNFGNMSDASPVLRRDQTAAVTEGITLNHGKHNFTAGGEFRRMQINSRTDQNARGSFSFSGLKTSDFNEKGQPLAGTGYDFADFLLGLPQSSSIRFGSANTYFRATVYNGYVSDDWKMRPNFTLNIGLRYEYFTPYQEKFGKMANLDIAPGFTGVAVVTPGASGPYSGEFTQSLLDPDKNNFSPRVGIAWRPFRKRQFLIRSGYGIFFNGSVYNSFPSRLASQPPFARTANLTTSLARTLTMQDGFAAAPSEKITNTFAVDRSYLVGYAQTWNFTVQDNLTRSLILEAGYLGTKGTRLDIQRMPNRAMPGSPLTAEQRRQIGNAIGFTFDTSIGNSIYHAGHVRITRRFQKNFSLNALYTYAKSIDNASNMGGGGNVVAQNDQDLSAERGVSTFTQRHALTAGYMISSPYGTASHMGVNGWRKRLLADWNLSGGITAASGMPFTARVLGNQANSGGTGAVGSGRADSTGAAIEGGTFFNLQAFTIPPPGRFGNAGRNTIPGPPRFSASLALGRSFPIGDGKRRFEFRIESYNFTNCVSYTSIGTVINAATYGLPLATLPMRTVSTTLRFRF